MEEPIPDPIPEPISEEEQLVINETILLACSSNSIYLIRLLINKCTNIAECAQEAATCDHCDIFQEIMNNDTNQLINYDTCSLAITEHGCIESLRMILSLMTNYNECLLLAITQGTNLNDPVYLDIGELLLPYSTFDTSILNGLRTKYS